MGMFVTMPNTSRRRLAPDRFNVTVYKDPRAEVSVNYEARVVTGGIFVNLLCFVDMKMPYARVGLVTKLEDIKRVKKQTNAEGFCKLEITFTTYVPNLEWEYKRQELSIHIGLDGRECDRFMKLIPSGV